MLIISGGQLWDQSMGMFSLPTEGYDLVVRCPATQMSATQVSVTQVSVTQVLVAASRDICIWHRSARHVPSHAHHTLNTSSVSSFPVIVLWILIHIYIVYIYVV